MAERLKGLLDSAREKIGGLLGDFPAGFNSGAVAGVAGYPGDIAYMLDTAGRALTGQHTQPAAQDFPGTTEYLAAKAGYPVPQSFSGQLGAAVGGILTPGPGDLAKFAPVLSAIPFWHGSPHKYDAVDLSKIGTGEGAQAYGHGYYGADAEATARSYMGGAQNFVSEPLFGGKEFSELPKETIKELDSLSGGTVFGMLDNVRQGQDPVATLKFYAESGGRNAEAAKRLLGMGVTSKQPNYLYKGEYRWPDPAKEAATPLTGEDLLDWDKPLSEQSPSVRNAADAALTALYPNYEKYRGGVERAAQLKREIVETAKRYEGPGDSGKSWRDLISKAPDDVQKEWSAKVQEFRTLEEDLPAIPQSGESLVRAAEETLGNAEASAFFQSLGIPGIRYKDQMSRGSEGGTYNYVMFQDKGIKLLERNGEPIPAVAEFAARREGKPKPYKEAMGIAPNDEALLTAQRNAAKPVEEGGLGLPPNNTAAERAAAMGYTVPAYRGSNSVETEAMPDVFWSQDPAYASAYGSVATLEPKHLRTPGVDPRRGWFDKDGNWVDAQQNVMPLLIRLGDDVVTGSEYLTHPYRPATVDPGNVDTVLLPDPYNPEVILEGQSRKPSNVRSRFAAFDPAKKDSANLLASLAALGIGIGAVKSQQEKEYQ